MPAHQATPAELDRLRVGSTLRRLRQLRKVTQVDLAAAMGTDKGYLSRIESGRKTLSDEMLAAAAAKLDVDVYDIKVPNADAEAVR